MSLSTGFVKVAQSGPTIDGREIKPEWLLEAADSYDKSVYTALIFPEHDITGQNYGYVEQVKAEKNNDGTVSLFADLEPNAFWQSDMRFKQKMFTSIALMPDFAGTGKMYLYGMAATDSPASLGVQQLEFSKRNAKAVFSSALEAKFTPPQNQTEDAEALSFAKRLFKLFKSEDDDMSAEDKAAIKALQQKLTEVETSYAALAEKLSGDKADKTTPTAEQFAALQTENTELKAKVEALEKQSADFSKLKTDLEALKLEFSAAVSGEIPGTDATKERVNSAKEFNLKYEI